MLLILLSIGWGIRLYANPSYEAIALVSLGKAVPKLDFTLLTGPYQGCILPPDIRIEGEAERTVSEYLKEHGTPAVIFRQKLSTMFRKFNVGFLRDGTDTFQLRFLSDNPELSVRIVNMIARNYVRLEGRRLAARNIVPDIGVSLSATEARLVRPYLWVPFLTVSAAE